MTNTQIAAVQFGLLGFLALWATSLIPQLLVQRTRYGRVVPRKLLHTASFLLYGCLALAVVFLPLPGPGAHRPAQTIQLLPFQWVTDIGTELDKHGLSDWHALTSQTFQQVAMNVALFVPLGLFARLLWKRSLALSTALGLGVSLLVEITQLTANFGTAPYAYRIFDVDDLLSNTAGVAVGWVVATAVVLLRAAAPAPAYAVGPSSANAIRSRV